MILSEAGEKILDDSGTGKWDGLWIAWRGSCEQLRAVFETCTGTGAARSKSDFTEVQGVSVLM